MEFMLLNCRHRDEFVTNADQIRILRDYILLIERCLDIALRLRFRWLDTFMDESRVDEVSRIARANEGHADSGLSIE